MGRPRLPIEEKIARGTMRLGREVRYAAESAVLEPPTPPPGPPAPMRDYEGISRAYVDGVLAGRTTASRWLTLACRRQRRDEQRAALDPGYAYAWQPGSLEQPEGWGMRACHFVECCPHVEGGPWETPTIRMEPWQVFLVLTLFGWRKRSNLALRRFTFFYLEVARKSAKTTLMAAVAYFHLLCEGEMGASVICGASTGEQARVPFDIMRKMGIKSAWLIRQGVDVKMNSITTADGRVRTVNSRAISLDGLNPSCILLDESHAQPFPLYNVLTSAQGSRQNPLVLCPTTAGYDLLSVGYALRGRLAKVLDQVQQADHLFGTIYALDQDDDWRDEQAWPKANPMIGISPTWDKMRSSCLDAQQIAGNENEFKVKACSIWVSGTRNWLSMTLWDRCAEEGLSIERFLGKRCWVGGDLAAVDDIACLAFVFREGDVVYGFVRGYLPRGVVEERARATPAYHDWSSGEHPVLVMTEGAMTDLNRVEADLRADCKRFDVQKVVFDVYGSAHLASRLAEDGIDAVIEPKNAKVTTAPMRALEAWVRHGKFRHAGCPMLKWFASNTHVRVGTDDTLLPKKETAESADKIDGMDALLSAIKAMLDDDSDGPKEFQLVVIGGRKPDAPAGEARA